MEEAAELPRIDAPEAVSPRDARALSKLFFDRLQVLEDSE